MRVAIEAPTVRVKTADHGRARASVAVGQDEHLTLETVALAAALMEKGSSDHPA